MLIFVATEVMLFVGILSAFTITKASAPFGWPPPDQPRLPLEQTAINTLALLASGVLLLIADRKFVKAPKSARGWVGASLVLGMAFVGLQGHEWVALIAQGLTMTSHQLGSFFYLIVGCHALHALAAILALGWTFVVLLRGSLTSSAFRTVQVFWYFVVGIWPVLYYVVYL
ncbi:MAG: cytochrome c oxidase subunit 3 [Sandaracinaceae bacterium]|nr:cytochrome c oxidase subunit 3 [Sandaracinaceae bacterium]